MAQRLLGTIETLYFDAFITERGLCYESNTYITGVSHSALCFCVIAISVTTRSPSEAQYRAALPQRIKWRCTHCFSTLFKEEELRDFFLFPVSSLL